MQSHILHALRLPIPFSSPRLHFRDCVITRSDFGQRKFRAPHLTSGVFLFAARVETPTFSKFGDSFLEFSRSLLSAVNGRPRGTHRLNRIFHNHIDHLINTAALARWVYTLRPAELFQQFLKVCRNPPQSAKGSQLIAANMRIRTCWNRFLSHGFETRTSFTHSPFSLLPPLKIQNQQKIESKL